MKLLLLILKYSSLVFGHNQLSILINVAISSRSHVSGILEITKELAERGHDIHYATASRYHAYAKGYNVTLHEFPDVPDEIYYGMGEGLQTYFRATRGLDKFLKYSTTAYDYFYQEYHKTFPSLTNLATKNHFDLIICDFYSLGCRDAANALKVPMVIGLQSTVAFDLFQSPFISNNVDGSPITTEKMTLLEKIFDFTVTRYNNWKINQVQRDALNDARTDFNIKTHKNFLDPFNQNLLISTSFIGFEPAFNAPPNLHMVGPIRSSIVKPISNELDQFLTSHKRIVYVGFGTYAVMIKEDIDDVTNGLKLLIEQGVVDGAVWGLGSNVFDHISHPDINFLPSAPQKSILNHNNTKLFISHCGIESVFESISEATPILCFPLIGDQPINAAKIEDAGIGLHHNRPNSTPESLVQLASTIIEDKSGSFNGNLIRLKSIADRRSLHATTNGANLLEDYAYTAHACRPFQSPDASVPCEVAHLIPASERMSFFKANLFDVYLALASVGCLILFSLFLLIKSVYNSMLLSSAPNNVTKKKTH